MNELAEVRELLAAHDPLTQSNEPLDDLAIERMWRGLLDDIENGTTSGVRAPARHNPRLVRSAVASVAVAACVLGGLAIAGQHNSPSARHYLSLQPLGYSRAVDPTSAAPTLRQLALVAGAQPEVGGPWFYLETASWSTFTGSDASSLPAGMPNVLEQWIGPDGSQRVVSHTDLPAPAAGLKAWLDAGLPLAGGRVETHTAPASDKKFPADLSTDPATLQKQLLDAEVGTERAGAPPEADELIAAVKDLRASYPMTPALQAAVLQMLADRPELISLGTATDRLGRTVQAIALDSTDSGLPTRHVLLFDPSDGELLGEEDMLTKSAGSLGVAIPSVISYAIYVRDGHVRTDTSLPPPL